MKIHSKEQLDILLETCKAIPHSSIKDGGRFYKVKSQSFLFPNGKIEDREYIDKRKASVVVPITNDGDIVFVIQPIALSSEGSLIEFPAGYWEFNENGIAAGKRELSEETGYIAGELIYLGEHYQDPGSIRQKVEIYLALGCEKVNEQNLDKGEFIKYIEVPYELAIELMEENYLKDANTYIALSKSDRFFQRKQQKRLVPQYKQKI